MKKTLPHSPGDSNASSSHCFTSSKLPNAGNSSSPTLECSALLRLLLGYRAAVVDRSAGWAVAARRLKEFGTKRPSTLRSTGKAVAGGGGRA